MSNEMIFQEELKRAEFKFIQIGLIKEWEVDKITKPSAIGCLMRFLYIFLRRNVSAAIHE